MMRAISDSANSSDMKSIASRKEKSAKCRSLGEVDGFKNYQLA